MHYDRSKRWVVVEPADIGGLTADQVFALLPGGGEPAIVHFLDFLEPTMWSRDDLRRTLETMHNACHERDILQQVGISYKPRLPALPNEVSFYRTCLFAGDGENLGVMVSLTESDLFRIAQNLHNLEQHREVHSIALVKSGALNAYLRSEQNRTWKVGQPVSTDILYRVAEVGIRHNHIVTFDIPGRSSLSKVGSVVVEHEHQITLKTRRFFQSTRFRPKRQGPKPIRSVPEPSLAERTEAGDFSASYSDALRNAMNRTINPMGLPPAHEEDADRARRPRRND